MIENGAGFARSYAGNAALLARDGRIDLTEHDACGVGLVAALDGKPRLLIALFAHLKRRAVHANVIREQEAFARRGCIAARVCKLVI